MIPRLLGQFELRDDAVRRLAATLNRRTTAQRGAGGAITLVQAVVVSVEGGSPPTCTVDFGGPGATLAGVRHYDSVKPAVGRVVDVQIRSGSPMVVGMPAA